MEDLTQMSLPRTAARRTVLGAFGAAALATAAAAAAAPAASAQVPPGVLIGPAGLGDLHVMTFNVRVESGASRPGEPDHWPDRIPAVQQLLRGEQPTLLGVQEALLHQLDVLAEALPPSYRSVGYGREGGGRGEHMSILYDAGRLRLLAWDQFWLSDTPTLIGSASWGNRITRTAIWAHFLDLSTGVEFVMVNTHLDHESPEARLRSAQVLRDLAGSFEGRPTLMTGDFNAPAAASDPFWVLTGSGFLRDTWFSAARRLTPGYATSPRYRRPWPGGKRLDWILTAGAVEVARTAINPFTLNGRWPSDHLPVQALVRFPAS